MTKLDPNRKVSLLDRDDGILSDYRVAMQCSPIERRDLIGRVKWLNLINFRTVPSKTCLQLDRLIFQLDIGLSAIHNFSHPMIDPGCLSSAPVHDDGNIGG